MSECKHEWKFQVGSESLYACAHCETDDFGELMPPGTAAELSALREQLDAAREAAADVDRAGGDAPHEPAMGLAAWIRARGQMHNDLARRLREAERDAEPWQRFLKGARVTQETTFNWGATKRQFWGMWFEGDFKHINQAIDATQEPQP